MNHGAKKAVIKLELEVGEDEAFDPDYMRRHLERLINQGYRAFETGGDFVSLRVTSFAVEERDVEVRG